jgi:hypothetical protein
MGKRKKKETAVPTIRADQILDLLSRRHSGDLFVAECKNGRSYGGAGQMVRADAWAMKRSYAKPCLWAYEIKVSRSDFVQDEKWPAYLPMCNQFYFVCPAELIQISECPDEAGLMWVAKTGTRAYTKKKAPYRKIEEPIAVYKYLLMSRAAIDTEYSICNTARNIDYWRGWLRDKEAKLELGTSCSRALHKSYEEQVYQVESRMKRMESEIERYKPVMELCEKLGVHPTRWGGAGDFEEAVKRARSGLPKGFMYSMINLKKDLENAIKYLEKLSQGDILGPDDDNNNNNNTI